MQIGIHGAALADKGEIADLGVTWTKSGANIAGEVSDLDEVFDSAEAMGLRVVVDLRTSHEYMEQVSTDTQYAMAQSGQLEDVPGGSPFDAEVMAAKARNLLKVNAEAYQPMYEAARETVVRYKDRCQDWEFWGEAACPWVSGQVFGDDSSTYPVLLRNVHQALKEADPTCRVWTSGNGMDLQLAFYHATLEQGGGPFFDVCNVHPYFMHVRVRRNADRVLEQEYSRLRKALAEQGMNQPFAATEWGYPTHDIDSVPHEDYLRSHVLTEGVRQLYWSEAAEWYERDLQAMERHGFQVVIVHSLRDDPAPDEPFWGQRCGLLDLQGRKKAGWDVVQRWAWKGREGKQAFA